MKGKNLRDVKQRKQETEEISVTTFLFAFDVTIGLKPCEIATHTLYINYFTIDGNTPSLNQE